MSTHNLPFSIYRKKKITLNYPKSAAMGFSKGLKSKFETAKVNGPWVFKPLNFYCKCVPFVLIQAGLEQLQNYLTSEKTVTELNKKVLNRKKKRVFTHFLFNHFQHHLTVKLQL